MIRYRTRPVTPTSYRVLSALDALDRLEPEGVLRYVASLQQPDGSFFGDEWGEVDTRFSYCALCCASLLDRLDEHAQAGRPVPLNRELQRFVLDTTTMCFMGHRMPDADARKLIVIFEEWLEEPPDATAVSMPPPHLKGHDRLGRAYGQILENCMIEQQARAAIRAARRTFSPPPQPTPAAPWTSTATVSRRRSSRIFQTCRSSTSRVP